MDAPGLAAGYFAVNVIGGLGRGLGIRRGPGHGLAVRRRRQRRGLEGLVPALEQLGVVDEAVAEAPQVRDTSDRWTPLLLPCAWNSFTVIMRPAPQSTTSANSILASPHASHNDLRKPTTSLGPR